MAIAIALVLSILAAAAGLSAYLGNPLVFVIAAMVIPNIVGCLPWPLHENGKRLLGEPPSQGEDSDSEFGFALAHQGEQPAPVIRD